MDGESQLWLLFLCEKQKGRDEMKKSKSYTSI